MKDRSGLILQWSVYLDISEEIKKLQEKKNRLKNQFLQAIGNDHGFTIGNMGSVFLSRYEKTHFLKDKFKKDYPGLWDEYTEKRKEIRLNVRRK
jgi:hypothetical protein